jgi:hypothetical protein
VSNGKRNLRTRSEKYRFFFIWKAISMGRKKRLSRADIDKYQLAEEKQQIADMINHKCYHCQWAKWADDGHVSCFWQQCVKLAGEIHGGG